jgi:juvenile hormone acid methyltransferase
MDPKLYIQTNNLQRRDGEAILAQHSDIFRWKNDGSDSLLDIGCGSSDVTIDFILPMMPKNFSKLVGVDISKLMIQHSKDLYENDHIKFYELDIGADIFNNAHEIEDDLKPNSFNCVTSFYTLHWVINQRY